MNIIEDRNSVDIKKIFKEKFKKGKWKIVKV